MSHTRLSCFVSTLQDEESGRWIKNDGRDFMVLIPESPRFTTALGPQESGSWGNQPDRREGNVIDLLSKQAAIDSANADTLGFGRTPPDEFAVNLLICKKPEIRQCGV